MIASVCSLLLVFLYTYSSLVGLGAGGIWGAGRAGMAGRNSNSVGMLLMADFVIKVTPSHMNRTRQGAAVQQMSVSGPFLAAYPPSPTCRDTQGLYLFTGAYNSACYNSTLGLEQGFGDPDLFGCGPWRQCPSSYQCTVGVEGSKCGCLVDVGPVMVGVPLR